MRTVSRFVLLSIVLGSGFAIAAPPASTGKGKAELPPPPGINDPGVSTPPAAQGSAAAPDEVLTTDSDADPLAPLAKPDTRIVRDKSTRDNAATAQRMAASERTTKQQGDDTVDEYRQNGKVWMIHIVSPQGQESTFMDATGTGRLARDPQQGPVAPVYFSLYDWN
jgi:hypothetical protein